MDRNKFVINGYVYPLGFVPLGGFLPHPPDKCEFKKEKSMGVTMIDITICATKCKRKCSRYSLWKHNKYEERQYILEKLYEFRG